jgi:hypothetical protein
MKQATNPIAAAISEVTSWLLSILAPPRNWSPQIRRTISSLAQAREISETANVLLAAGITERTVSKLLLFIPSAFAREVYEPQGIRFPDYYLRPWWGAVVRLPYRREPIYAQARTIAREFIAQGQSMEVDQVLRWSAERSLVEQGMERGVKLRQVVEILHEL